MIIITLNERPDYSQTIFAMNTQAFIANNSVTASSMTIESDFYHVKNNASYAAERFTIIPYIRERRFPVLGALGVLFQTPNGYINDVESSAYFGGIKTIGHRLRSNRPAYTFTDNFTNNRRVPSTIEQLQDSYNLGLDVLRKTGKPIQIIPPERFMKSIIMIYDYSSYEKDIPIGFHPDLISETKIEAGIRDNGARTTGLVRLIGEKPDRNVIESYLL